MSLASTIERLVQAAIEARLFPGAVVLVAQGERLVHHAAYGTTMYDDQGSRPVAADDLYDIASITKAITATTALQLLDAGVLTLDTPLATLLPSSRAVGVTMRHLLTHTSGLGLRLAPLREQGPAGLLAAVLAAEPAAAPGSATAYSNINTLLLGLAVEHATGTPLDAFVQRQLLRPIGMHDTCFLPAAALRVRIVPTEYDPWRGRLVHGEVHDESAYVLGGACGHAGLFATADDLWRFGLLWLRGGTLGGKRFLREALVTLATANQTPGLAQACGLGWMLDRPFMPAERQGAYGHTGFTGPTLLVLPRHDLVVVLLCNRTYPHRHEARTHSLVATIAALAIAPGP